MCNPESIRQLKYLLDGLDSDDPVIHHIRPTFQAEHNAMGFISWIDWVMPVLALGATGYASPWDVISQQRDRFRY